MWQENEKTNTPPFFVPPMAPPDKTRKPRDTKPYTKKPGPKGPNAKNCPATSAQPLKKSKERLTNSDWIEVYR